MTRRILLSYAREDAAVVAEMAADLRALDHEVWLDQDLGGGQDWWDEILARIRWCDAFLPVLSAAALRLRACTSERVYGVALDRPVLPVAVGDLGPEGLLDEDLARRQRISYRAGSKPSTLRLLAAVHRLAPAPPLPDIDPTPPPAPMAYFGVLRAELDGSASIDFDRQLVLLGRLSAESEDTDRHPEILALVEIFMARREIAAYVQRQLDVLLARINDARGEAVTSIPIDGRSHDVRRDTERTADKPSSAPKPLISPPTRSDAKPTATLRTSEGDIRINLFPDHAPKTVANFVGLASGDEEVHRRPNASGGDAGPFYDGSIFHRVISGFMLQGGDPTGHRPRRPGLPVRRRVPPGADVRPPVPARHGERRPGYERLAVLHHGGAQPHLNRKHTIFGEVADAASRAVVDAIATTTTDRADRPLTDIVVQRVELSD